jgi:hypothetical protein
MTPLRPVDHHTRQQLNEHLASIERALDADLLTIITPILSGLKNAVEMFKERRARISVILETPGGIVEVVERMVHVIRHHYLEVYFVVPDHAMSAGTVFVMSGDKIFMNYFSCLGPIDPQIEKDGKLVPALSYLNQFQRLSEKADNGTLNTAEFALLNKLTLVNCINSNRRESCLKIYLCAGSRRTNSKIGRITLRLETLSRRMKRKFARGRLQKR